MATLIELWADNASTVLANSISATSGTLNVASGTGLKFPTITPGTTYFRLVLTPATAPNSVIEVVLVTNVVGDTFTITRAQEGTTAQAWAVGDIAFNAFSAGGVQTFAQANGVQNNFYVSGTESGTANAYVVTMAYPTSTNVQYQEVIFKATHANTGASTITIGSGPVINIIGMSGSALQGGEIALNSIVKCVYNGSQYVLVYSSGGAQTTADAAQSHQAIAWGQQGALNVLHAVNADLATNALHANTADAVPFFPTGTRVVFAQASAPTGWSQITDDTTNNRMIVLVNGTGGGTLGGSMSPTLMNVVPAHTHSFTSSAENATHTHTLTTGAESNGHAHGLSGSTSTADLSHVHTFTSNPTNIDHFHNGTTGGMNANNPHNHAITDPGHRHGWDSQPALSNGAGGGGGNGNVQNQTGVQMSIAVTGISIKSQDINHGHPFTTSYIAGGNNVPAHSHTGTSDGMSQNGTHSHTISGSTGNESTTHTHSGTTSTESATHAHTGTTDTGSSATNWAPRYQYMIVCQKL